MTQISITSSLYKTERFLSRWKDRLYKFSKKAQELGLEFEINAIANDPSEFEMKILNELATNSWFNLYKVPRESFYKSWHRGTEVANYNICTSWNVDDDRNPEAIIDGFNLIKNGTDIVYFPFIYKRYISILNCELLVKNKIFNPPQFKKEIFEKEMHCGPFFMFTKDIYEKTGDFDSSFKISGDFDWCVRATNYAIFAKSELIAGTFEKREGTLSGGKNILQESENQRIITK